MTNTKPYFPKETRLDYPLRVLSERLVELKDDYLRIVSLHNSGFKGCVNIDESEIALRTIAILMNRTEEAIILLTEFNIEIDE